MAHEILVDLFKNRPSMAAEILTEVLGVSLPGYTDARVASVDLTEVQPAEYRADAVFVLLDGETSVRVVIVEVQLATDPRKRLTWPVYVTVSRALHGCPAALLVVAPDPAIAGWCSEPIETGPPGFVLRPSVLRRDAIPIVTDPEQAALRPELGVLSAIAHGDSDLGDTIAAAVLPAVLDLDEDRARFYYDIVYTSLNDAARRALETQMKGYQYQSDFAKKYVAEGISQGISQGVSQGRAEEAARNLLIVLRARGIAVPDEIRERILAQKDPERLERWLERAAVASSVAAVLDELN